MQVDGQVVMVIHHDVAVAVQVSVNVSSVLDHVVRLASHFLSGGNDGATGYH